MLHDHARRTSIAIIGGGIGGLTAAACLLRAGFDVQVYEQTSTLGEVGAGTNIGPNASRILQRADVPLNERGKRQAEQLARRLSDAGFVHIVCSDLLRARMTAAIIAARSTIAIEENPLLQERNFGDLRGVFDRLDAAAYVACAGHALEIRSSKFEIRNKSEVQKLNCLHRNHL